MSRRALLLAALLALAPATLAAHQRPALPWQQVTLPEDRERLRLWRDTWVEAARQARAAGNGARIAAEGALLDPDATLPTLDLPDGRYTCRTIKLGAAGSLGTTPAGRIGVAPPTNVVPIGDRPTFSAHPAVPCEVAAGHFTVEGGVQRPVGRLLPDDAARLVFLGTLVIGDEQRALAYRRDYLRDSVGLMQRIGERRWRLVLPRPRWESLVDVIEIVPAA